MHHHDRKATGGTVNFSVNNDPERATSLAFCRDTITRISDKGLLQRAHIETLLSERVSETIISLQTF